MPLTLFSIFFSSIKAYMLEYSGSCAGFSDMDYLPMNINQKQNATHLSKVKNKNLQVDSGVICWLSLLADSHTTNI